MKEVFQEFINGFKEQIMDAKKNGLKHQIPNLLTLSRALAPFVIIPTIIIGKLEVAIIELVFFEVTDFFDGKIARKFNCVTDFGVKLDAICDKVFALGIMIPAIIKYPVLMINLILEACISYINLLSEFKNNNPKSNMIGKIKTAFLGVTLILAYIPDINGLYVLLSSMATFMLQIMAFVKYRESDIDKDNKKRGRKKALQN